MNIININAQLAKLEQLFMQKVKFKFIYVKYYHVFSKHKI